MRRILAVALLIAVVASPAAAQTGTLTGMKICIDPGHGGHNAANDRHLIPDPGTDFWESESNFQKALLLKGMLEAKGAIVLLTRETNDYPDDTLEPSLPTRVAFANANSVDWFHSIHSNATGLPVNTGTNYTLMLVREKRPGGPASGTGNGLGVPETQEAWDISRLYMSPLIKSYLRTQRYQTSLDWTFYGGTNGGFSLGVLRGLLMPGQLSEGSMHDYYPETRRLMNQAYRKVEAYALLHSFMQFKAVPMVQAAIVGGILTDFASGKPINYVRVRLLPENRVYVGDQYNNGFYAFDSVAPGPHTLRFETPGYRTDSVAVDLQAGAPVFVDRSFESTAAPTIVISSPAMGDSAFMPNGVIVLTFSKSMDTASVRSGFSITPPVPGRLSWATNNSKLTFQPDTVLPLGAWMSVRLDTSVRAASGQQIDGNADGTPGDPYVLTFKTLVADVFPPAVVVATPGAGGKLPTMNTPVYVTFNERLDPSTVKIENISVQLVGGGLVPRIVEYAEITGQGSVTVFLSPTGTVPGASYRIRISGVADLKGNAISTTKPLLWEFSVAPDAYTYTVLDSLFCSNSVWGLPDTSAGSTGYLYASFTPDARKVPGISGNLGSGRLDLGWDTVASPGLIRLPVTAGPAAAITWTKSNKVLQTYVYGDGSRAQFRFCVADSVEVFPGGTPSNREVSPWYTVDWVGWHLVGWDLERDSIGTWMGNGILEGQLRFESFHIRRVHGYTWASTTILLDQLQLATRAVVGVEGLSPAEPAVFELGQNYPNPFNPTTVVRSQWPVASDVKLAVYDVLGREVAVLAEGRFPAGQYEFPFDAAGMASGVYLYRLSAGKFTETKRMILMR